MKGIMPVALRKRTLDKWGAGRFGAPRGARKHNGQDYVIPPECQVLSTIDGVVKKHGQPYKGPEYKYIQIDDKDGYEHRFFYVEPVLNPGSEVKIGQVIGYSQDLNARYEGITPHVHYEIRKGGEYFNPEEFFRKG